jgi:hypothetical protein
MKRTLVFTAGGTLLVAAAIIAQNDPDLGFTDTPILPGQTWHVHDYNRPHPPVVTPGTCSTQDKPGKAPSDAIVLFDGKDLSQWTDDKGGAPEWTLKDGYVAVGGKTDLVSKLKFGSVQLHVEWTEPPTIQGKGQGRGNSGVILMSRYEIQVLDNYQSPTYADGTAGAIYGQWPPLANAVRKPGDWNSYDIVFEAPVFESGKLVKPAFQTVFVNGVCVHNHKEVMGAMVYRAVGTYSPHAAEEPLMLQNHHNPVRYRNIWVRKMHGYDEKS